MIAEPPEFIRKGFPRTCYHPQCRLLAWFPRGVFNAAFAEQILEFVQMEERIQDAPFDRYTDLSGLTDVRLKLDHVFQIAGRRRTVREPVKSAFVAESPVGFVLAQTYEHLTAHAMIDVRAFRHRTAAAEWLEVPMKILEPPS